MFKIITVIEKHYVRTEFFKLFKWNTWSVQISIPHITLLNVLHNGIQGSLEDAANVGSSVNRSDQGKVSGVFIACSIARIALILSIAAVPSLVTRVVVTIVGVVRGLSDQPCTFMKVMCKRCKAKIYCSPPAEVSELAKYWERTRQWE